MVLRMILRYFANNDQLVQRLSESYPVRRAAQMAVSLFYRTKNLAEDKNIITPERFRNFFRLFQQNLKQEIEGAKEKMKKK